MIRINRLLRLLGNLNFPLNIQRDTHKNHQNKSLAPATFANKPAMHAITFFAFKSDCYKPESAI